ncbi:response regulator [Sphingobacterium spiritivorum]|uniref:response regulator n=1 Tax=Sphingobacterium spiritivorum TaxID=258 RepID=UPI003DA353A4
MFRKVLIAEDQESANISVRKTLADLGIQHTDYVYYCDDALTRIEKALKADQPYDLLITDLSFEEDQYRQRLPNGDDLIKAVKQEQPTIKIVVFSAEDMSQVIDTLFEELSIDAYVRKARNDAQYLKEAINTIYQNRKYRSPNLKPIVKERNSYEFADFDITIISLLSQGVLQKDIPFHLQQRNIKPSGLSSVEKRLNHMKESLDFTKNEQLIAFCKDIGII